ncbi:HAD family hydrolase [Streptacidiphilus pinicola]|uniref:HAD family hydrolase n=1 Tax=Streptacidiphilus pinicola TaxID=2219663 RepID=A0A2X0IE19_9ACTN|nr:HAD family hydrolase [Streptacidiphilus pinicola]RAG81671.1 HAD family hydrolase [Streptacidiphilus pinicola]
MSEPLLRGVQAVFFDFDGPLVELFRNHDAQGIADRIFDAEKSLTRSDFRRPNDPHAVVAQLPELYAQDSDLVARVEKLLTGEELLAARHPGRIAGACELVRALHERGILLAVTSNNSPEAIQVCLGPGGILGAVGECFEGRISGRDPDPRLMKPHPSCVERAIGSVGLPASKCLLIGDSVSDIEAADRAGVPFLGFAASTRALKRLAERGAPLVRSHVELLRAMGP